MQGDEILENPGSRRQYTRFEDRRRVMVTVLSAPDSPQIESRNYFCWTRDLSAGGLRFCVHSRVPVGTILKLEIMFDEPQELFRHIGKVMWEQEFIDTDVTSNWLGVQITETLGGESRSARWKVCVEHNANPLV